MAIFKLTAHDDSIVLVLAAKCLSCARNIAANGAGVEGPRMWLDPSKSTCELMRDNMTPQIIVRSTKNDD